MTFSTGYNYAQLSAEYVGLLEGYELGLAVESDDLPSEPTYISDANGRVSGLAESTAYVVYTRLKATENSFCSAWYYNEAVRTFTAAAAHLTVSTKNPVYIWRPNFSLPEFNIKRFSIQFTNKNGGGVASINSGNYRLAITDESGAPAADKTIRNAGEYTVTVKLDEDIGNYALDKDTFTITVNPIDLSTAQISLPTGTQSPVYTGQTAWPDVTSISVTVNGSTRTLSATNYWQLEIASGKNDVNAGDACVLVSTKSGQGNVVGSGEPAYTISPAAFAGTVSMAGYVYGQTPSTPVLNGYAGDSEVNFIYRAKGAAQWSAWQDITATSLVPDDYEIIACVANTINYNGGETAAEFTVSHAKLGVSIQCPTTPTAAQCPPRRSPRPTKG